MKQEEKTNNSDVLNNNLFFCRKCMKFLPENNFYNALDGGLVDTSGKFSICKKDVQEIYDSIYNITGSMEKTIHRLCQIFNIRFTNEALDATKTHINTLQDSGKNVNAIFSIYLMKLIATKKSMDKSGTNDFQYEDVGTIFVDKEQVNTKETSIPQDVLDFWGRGLSREDIEFLEREYANFKNTHSAETYAEIVLLKEVCYTMLKIEKQRRDKDPDTGDSVKELQSLMKNLAISPNAIKSNSGGPGADSFGLWIADIEKEEPAQWLKTDPRGDMYRDVGNVEEYFQKYFVRPMKNFIQGSKDFNVDDTETEDFELDPSEVDTFAHIDDGETEK